jgi:hypothetical protein
MRLFDLEPQFIGSACAKRGVDVPNFNCNKPLGPQGIDNLRGQMPDQNRRVSMKGFTSAARASSIQSSARRFHASRSAWFVAFSAFSSHSSASQ